jgi:hypothetical protein
MMNGGRHIESLDEIMTNGGGHIESLDEIMMNGIIIQQVSHASSTHNFKSTHI